MKCQHITQIRATPIKSRRHQEPDCVAPPMNLPLVKCRLRKSWLRLGGSKQSSPPLDL